MYIVKVETEKQLNIVLQYSNVKEIIIARDSFDEKKIYKYIEIIKNEGKSASILLERISRYDDLSGEKLRKSTDILLEIEGLNKIIIQNFDCFSYILRKMNIISNKNIIVELNYTMNCYNNETKKVYEMLYNEKCNNNEMKLRFTTPLELNNYEISDIKYDTIVVYGYVDTMVSANCIYKNTNKKCYQDNANKNNTIVSTIGVLKDRKNKNLYYKTYCKYCYNKIFNTEPTYLIDIINEYSCFFEMDKRIDFTFENENEVNEILQEKRPASFTRGHIKNGIK